MARASNKPAQQKLASRKLYRRRQSLICALKVAIGCVDCGYNDNPNALEWDHLPGHEKAWEMGRMQVSSLEVFLAEMAKCEVVCSNCHRGRTMRRSGLEPIPFERTDPDTALQLLIEGWRL